MGKGTRKLEMIPAMPALFIDDMVGGYGTFLLEMGAGMTMQRFLSDCHPGL